MRPREVVILPHSLLPSGLNRSLRKETFMVRRRCLRGGGQSEADGIPLMMNCHCSMCRTASGAAFGTFGHARPEQFRYRKGQELITLYVSSPDNRRGFCCVCGSNLRAERVPR